jgi:hypothetical protein
VFKNDLDYFSASNFIRMKKLLLSISALVVGYAAYAQVVVAGVSPAAIQGNYTYGIQVNCGLWPGQTDDGTWGVWNGGLDFNNPGDFVQDTLMLVEDGTPGFNPQGNPISQEGCDTLINDLTGKIAVIYRNTCWFSAKIRYAQMAGAVAAIIINREPGITNMLANTDPQNGPLGTECNIPAVFIDNTDGQNIVAEMANGPVVMFIGNKIGAYGDDVGAVKGEFLVAPYGGVNSYVFNGFEPGIQVYNYGTNAANVTVTASIDHATSGNVYTDVVGPIAMNSGDTLPIFPGNTEAFAAFDLGLGNYPAGDYTLSYTIDGGATDEAVFDNYYEAEFKVQTDVVSSSRLDAMDMPVSNSYPSNSTTEYQSCMMYQEANNGQWDDGWVDLNDPNYTFDPATNDAYQNLNLVTFRDYYPSSENEVDQVAYAEFTTPFLLVDGQRYLFCLQTFESTTISFGYDNAIDYGANYSIFAQPISPVHVDGMWYTAGWSGVSAPSIAINTSAASIDETSILDGSAYPNPAEDVVTIKVDANGSAELSIVDVSGKLVQSQSIELNNNLTNVDVSALEAGVYVFNITMENGERSIFNVVKK